MRKISVGLGQGCINKLRIREVGRIMEVLISHNEDFGLYSKYDVNLLICFKEGF